MADDVIDRAQCRRPPLEGRLRTLLAETARDLRAAEATLWLVSADGLTMAAALNHGPTATIVEAQSVPTEESVVGAVATHGSAMTVGPDEYQHPAVMDATGTRVQSMVAVPVRMGAEVVGTLSAINPEGRERFRDGDLAAAGWKAFLIEAVLTHGTIEASTASG